jgi:hypothetical protein
MVVVDSLVPARAKPLTPIILVVMNGCVERVFGFFSRIGLDPLPYVFKNVVVMNDLFFGDLGADNSDAGDKSGFCAGRVGITPSPFQRSFVDDAHLRYLMPSSFFRQLATAWLVKSELESLMEYRAFTTSNPLGARSVHE